MKVKRILVVAFVVNDWIIVKQTSVKTEKNEQVGDSIQ